jgi:RHH-type rel operon transcriptional repressor/antitoxin RelB
MPHCYTCIAKETPHARHPPATRHRKAPRCLGQEDGRTKTYYAREAILTHLENLEDAALAEKRLDEFYKSGEKAIPLEEIVKRYVLED